MILQKVQEQYLLSLHSLQNLSLLYEINYNKPSSANEKYLS